MPDKPSPLREADYAKFQPLLPEGAIIIGALPTYHAKETARGDCSICFYALDDHTIHRSTICGGGTDYEITDDAVVGTW